MPNNWKEEIKEYANGSEHRLSCIGWSEGQCCCLELPEVHKFIETEIIEALIEDIPDRIFLKTPEGNMANYAGPLKQQLRAKWLGGHNA